MLGVQEVPIESPSQAGYQRLLGYKGKRGTLFLLKSLNHYGLMKLTSSVSGWQSDWNEGLVSRSGLIYGDADIGEAQMNALATGYRDR